MEEIRIVTTKDELVDSLILRRNVFCLEQGVSYLDEFDLVEKERIVFNGYQNGKIVATGRLNIGQNRAKFERVCVLKEYRNKCWGSKIMLYMTQYALAHKNEFKIEKLVLEGQVQAMGFYQKLGFTKTGDMFFDAGIEHYLMVKDIK